MKANNYDVIIENTDFDDFDEQSGENEHANPNAFLENEAQNQKFNLVAQLYYCDTTNLTII